MSPAGEQEPDELERAVVILGRAVAILLFNAGWVRRRKDTLELLDDTWVRRKISIDVVIPPSLEPITGAEGKAEALYTVPVTLLPKVPPSLMRFDFSSQSTQLTMPTRRQNGLAGYAAMLWACGQALQQWPLPVSLRKELLFIALGPSDYARQVSYGIRAPGRGRVPVLPASEAIPPLETAEQELVRWVAEMRGVAAPAISVDTSPDVDINAMAALHREIAEDPLCGWLLRKTAHSSPLVAHLAKSQTGRQTIALSYDENVFKELDSAGQEHVALMGWRSYPFSVQTPYVGAGSYHFEFLAPDGLEVNDSRLIEQSPEEDDDSVAAPVDGPVADDAETDREEGRPEYDVLPHRGGRIHLYLPESAQVDALTALIQLRAAREAFVAPAFWAASAVAATVVVCTVAADALVRHAAGAQSLMLLFPGLFATLVARAGGHRQIIRMLQRARRSLIWSGVTAYLAAGLLVFIDTGREASASVAIYLYYGSLSLVALWQAAKLFLARTLPRPVQDGLLERFVDGVSRRRTRRARRAARRRERSLWIVARPPTRDWAMVRALAKRAPQHLSVATVVGPSRRWLLDESPHLRLCSSDESEPLLALSARPGDVWLRQSVRLQRDLSEAIRWLTHELPEGFEIEVRWLPFWRRVRWVQKNVVRMIRRKRWSSGKLRRVTARPGGEVADAARRGSLRLQRVYEIEARDDA